MKIVDEMPPRNTYPVADFRLDLNLLAKRLGVQPQLSSWKDEDIADLMHESKDIFMHLSTGRYAYLSVTSMRSSIVEIGLEVHEIGDDDAFYEEDLKEVINAIGIDEEYIKIARQLVRIGLGKK